VKKFRVPLAGAYTSRVSRITSSDTSSGYVGIGVVGTMIVGKSAQTEKDARYINCFAQTVSDPITGKKHVYAVKRPGFTTNSTPRSGHEGAAIMVWTGSDNEVISAFGDPSTIYSGSTSLGAITGGCTGITETSINGTATLVVSSDDNTGWYYDGNVGVMTRITDAQWPGTSNTEELAGTFAHMDGFAFIMTTRGRLWASDINSITSWTANSFGTTNAYPDKGIGCIRHRNFIMAFGTESVEFWHNAGLSPFPFARANAMTLKVGAVSEDAIARIADTIFWVGTTPEGGMSVFQFDGQLSRVSAPEVEAIMLLAGASNVSVTTLRVLGRSFVLVLAGQTTLAYVVEEKMWHEWNSTTLPLWFKCASVMLGDSMLNYAVSDKTLSGKVYLMNPAALVFQDDGNAYTARIQSGPEDEGTDHTKFYHDLNVVADTESSTSTLTILCSDDDYANYTTLGTVDLSGTRPLRLTGLGSAKQRAWAMTHSANTPMRIRRAEGTLTVGTH
jgi:hypothetical protein